MSLVSIVSATQPSPPPKQTAQDLARELFCDSQGDLSPHQMKVAARKAGVSMHGLEKLQVSLDTELSKISAYVEPRYTAILQSSSCEAAQEVLSRHLNERGLAGLDKVENGDVDNCLKKMAQLKTRTGKRTTHIVERKLGSLDAECRSSITAETNIGIVVRYAGEDRTTITEDTMQKPPLQTLPYSIMLA